MKKITALITALSIMSAMLCGCGAIFDRGYDINSYTPPESVKSAPGALEVFGGEDTGFSFLYPYDMDVSWSDEDGACISSGEGKIPYVLVNKTEKKNMTPEKYFKASDRQILKEFDLVQSSTIHEVPLGKKTLYMTRYQCTAGEAEIYIERYVEIYKDCYIQYTAVTNTVGEMNTALYYASTTLSPEAGTYFGEYSEKLETRSQEDTGLAIAPGNA